MTAKKRFLTALARGKPDRLPVTTHHLMPYFLERYMGGISSDECFARFGMDPIRWIYPHRPDPARETYFNPNQAKTGFLETRLISSDDWRIEMEEVPVENGRLTRYRFVTPSKTLTMALQSNSHTSWVTENLVKEKSEIDVIAAHVTTPLCDVEEVNREADAYGEKGLIRGHIPAFDVFGQPGCWQDACCLYGTEKMIMETFDDPSWVHQFLRILQKRKLGYIASMLGARYDINELGGGDASSTVISPALFDEFVAPYDAALISAAHNVGQRIVYHTCGGMMPILERVAAMGPDAMETFSPPGMGGDAHLAEAKHRIGNKACMIGGFDQGFYFSRASAEQVRAAVRKCFQDAGEGGGFIIAPSDHFFDADPRLLEAFADEARKCRYGE
jgi:uroporphyrinogen decarboxylase